MKKMKYPFWPQWGTNSSQILKIFSIDQNVQPQSTGPIQIDMSHVVQLFGHRFGLRKNSNFLKNEFRKYTLKKLDRLVPAFTIGHSTQWIGWFVVESSCWEEKIKDIQ